MRIHGERIKRTRLIQTDRFVVAVDVEMGISIDDPRGPCYESETIRLLRDVKDHAERADVAWLTKKGRVYRAAGGPYTMYEGDSLSLDASASSDPDGDALSYFWYVNGDGIFVDATGVAPTISWTDLVALGIDDGPDNRNVKVRVDDGNGGVSESPSTTLEVLNVDPTVTITAPASGAVFAVGTNVNFVGSFSDPGTLDTHDNAGTTWSFVSAGFGFSVPGNVTESDGDGAVNNDVSFTNPGVYKVTLTVTDDDNGAGSATVVNGDADLEAMVVVYDPSAGFVTGGGWIDSPEGAFAADPSLTGKASFGFVSKYQQGANVPTGETEFRFRVADLNFHSTSYDWLVVAGARAQFKGTGTINGSGNYGYMITAIDGALPGGGGSDKFRIKIWDKDDNDAIVYDNQLGADDDDDPTTVLGGGQVVIHKEGIALHTTRAASGEGTASPLTPSALRPVVQQAIAYWSNAGADASQLEALNRADVQIANLSGSLLGVHSPTGIIWIDRDAAGHGWSVDSRSVVSTGRIDLRTVVAHELGHALGLDHGDSHDVMGDTLAPGVNWPGALFAGSDALVTAALPTAVRAYGTVDHNPRESRLSFAYFEPLRERTSLGNDPNWTQLSPCHDGRANITARSTSDPYGRELERASAALVDRAIVAWTEDEH